MVDNESQVSPYLRERNYKYEKEKAYSLGLESELPL